MADRAFGLCARSRCVAGVALLGFSHRPMHTQQTNAPERCQLCGDPILPGQVALVPVCKGSHAPSTSDSGVWAVVNLQCCASCAANYGTAADSY